MEISITCRCTDDHTVIAHDSLESKYLSTQSLHHHNRVGSHSITIVEFLRHTKYKNIIFFFCPVYVSSLVCKLPADRHHFFCIAGINCNLSGLCIQHCITAEERMSHLFFHMHTDLIKFITHKASAVNRCKIISVHNRRYMMACNASPVCNTCCTVFVST